MNVKIKKYIKLIYKIKACLQRRPPATIIVMSKRNWGDMETNKVMFTPKHQGSDMKRKNFCRGYESQYHDKCKHWLPVRRYTPGSPYCTTPSGTCKKFLGELFHLHWLTSHYGPVEQG